MYEMYSFFQRNQEQISLDFTWNAENVNKFVNIHSRL